MTRANVAGVLPEQVEDELRLVARSRHPADTIIDLGDVRIGNGYFTLIAGPCAVESEEQISLCADEIASMGVKILRGGCFKARTSPYSFRGLGLEGLEYLEAAGRRNRLAIISEVISHEQVDEFARRASILQIGARNMQNYSLLTAAAKSKKPIMLKRGISASLDELLLAAEYILAQGNDQVILCERGIRSFQSDTRYTLDISAVPVLRLRTHLPILVDPSHAAGRRDLVIPLALAAKAAGAHGIMVEVHPSPEKALSDGPQALTFKQFEELVHKLNLIPQN